MWAKGLAVPSPPKGVKIKVATWALPSRGRPKKEGGNHCGSITPAFLGAQNMGTVASWKISVDNLWPYRNHKAKHTIEKVSSSLLQYPHFIDFQYSTDFIYFLSEILFKFHWMTIGCVNYIITYENVPQDLAVCLAV